MRPSRLGLLARDPAGRLRISPSHGTLPARRPRSRACGHMARLAREGAVFYGDRGRRAWRLHAVEPHRLRHRSRPSAGRSSTGGPRFTHSIYGSAATSGLTFFCRQSVQRFQCLGAARQPDKRLEQPAAVRRGNGFWQPTLAGQLPVVVLLICAAGRTGYSPAAPKGRRCVPSCRRA